MRKVQWNPFLLLLLFVLANAEEESLEALQLELVHRHDPRLPGNENLKLDKFEAVRDRALRAVARRNKQYLNGEMVQMLMRTGYDYLASEYFVQVRVGTPSQNFWLVADTGSELTWIRCNDNHNLSESEEGHSHTESQSQSRRSALRVQGRREFYRKLSTTYQTVTCGDERCISDDFANMFAEPRCELPTDLCPYMYKYIDGTVAMGYFGTDVVTPGVKRDKKRKVSLVVGCTKKIDSRSFNNYTDGVLGLNHNPNSFMSRATQQFGRKFSYCLMDHTLHKNVTNFLTLGSYDETKTPQSFLTTPLQYTQLVLVGSYGVKVKGISVNGEMLPIPPEVWDFRLDAGVIMDTGASLSFLPKPAYGIVVDALYKPILAKYKRKPNGRDIEPFTACFDAEYDYDNLQKVVPKLAIHFEDGPVLNPPVLNYIIHAAPNTQCIGILENNDPTSILGNLMQQYHFWEFDLDKRLVGFAPSQCK